MLNALKHLRLNTMKLQSLLSAKLATPFLLERKRWCKAWTFILKWCPPHSAYCAWISSISNNLKMPRFEIDDSLCGGFKRRFCFYWYLERWLDLTWFDSCFNIFQEWKVRPSWVLSHSVPNQYHQYIPCRRFIRIHVISLHGPGMRFARNTWKPSRSAMLKQNWSMQLGSTIKATNLMTFTSLPPTVRYGKYEERYVTLFCQKFAGLVKHHLSFIYAFALFYAYADVLLCMLGWGVCALAGAGLCLL